MEGFKLARAEDLSWESPVLSFTLERHGGSVHGSKRAELQRWSINLQDATASCDKQGHRQLTPAAPRLDVKPIAEQIFAAVQLGPASKCGFVRRGILEWERDYEVCIRHGALIPDEGPQQTVRARRKRLRGELQSRMESDGWKLESVRARMRFKRKT